MCMGHVCALRDRRGREGGREGEREGEGEGERERERERDGNEREAREREMLTQCHGRAKS